MSTPEALLNTLRKLDANKACANCDAVAKFGHGNICEKFKTFVCNHCKSAHQSYSHRVKSVTMSNWTREDVDALKEEHGGGNALARRTWLASWKDGDGRSLRKPLETDHLDVFKKFINAVYNDKAYFSEPNAAPSSSRPKPTPPPPHVSSIVSTHASTSGDLLGFSPPPTSSLSSATFEANFDAFSAPVPPQLATSSFEATFDAFPPPSAVATTTPQHHHDEWSAFQSATVVPPAPISTPFDPFGIPSAAAGATSSTSPSLAFDPFASTTTSTSSTSSTPTHHRGPPTPQHSHAGTAINSLLQPAVGLHGFGVPNNQQPFNQALYPQGGGQLSNITYSGGGGASISSFLDPTLVASPHPRPPLGGQPSYHHQPTFQPQPSYQQQGYHRPSQTSGGRDPFAGLAFK
ncbi:hypothetical protein H257_13931 [Aphanomyces astaci]|uniref:Arf-GAP domain-containing protein n=1 Tax=Aphanomyces astaci TaxID=112090 RepID=W4FUS2_APHAT|nr:hypothetical protein H257_13931 [Aphanomyces astaci]ETV70544.1 hypothetical protein H257_13931 [Aphanomyces astaci]|eukprot:XP_009839927.1 hypothetical protein H257_13931 [Aphanomyces astaci]